MAQRKVESDKAPKNKLGVAAAKPGKVLSLDESLKRMHKRHGKLLKKLAE